MQWEMQAAEWHWTSTISQVCALGLGLRVSKHWAGRVRRSSSKAVELVQLGRLHVQPGWHNEGYIFPLGYVARTVFRGSARPSLCLHLSERIATLEPRHPAESMKSTSNGLHILNSQAHTNCHVM